MSGREKYWLWFDPKCRWQVTSFDPRLESPTKDNWDAMLTKPKVYINEDYVLELEAELSKSRQDKATKYLDRNGKQISVGDNLKFYHFTDKRDKKHFIYRQVAVVNNKPVAMADNGFFTFLDAIANGNPTLKDAEIVCKEV